MKRAFSLYGMVFVVAVACMAPLAEAATVGLNPSDGVNMFVKAFSVSAGTTITGAQFGNNDAETVFPSVVLVRGGTGSLASGTSVRSSSNVSETSGGVVTVTWSSPVVVTESGTYYVGVRPPEGSGKQGNGDGPAIGATAVSSPAGSYIASGENGELSATRVNLDISLQTTGGQGKAGVQPGVARTFLSEPTPNPFNPSTQIEFGVAERTQVQLAIYDVGGRVVRVLASGMLEPGEHRVIWDGRDSSGQPSATGVYFARFSVGTQLIQKKLVLLK